MTKQDLKKLISEQNEITQKDAERAIDLVIEGIKEALKQDDKVAIQGFLTFEIKDTKASSGVINGIEWEKPAGQKVAVKVSKIFQTEIVGE